MRGTQSQGDESVKNNIRITVTDGQLSASLPQFSIDVSFGEFYDGHLTRTNASIQLRPSSYVFVSLSYQQNDGRGSDRTNLTPEEMDLLDGGTVSKGDFTQRLAIGRIDFAFTPQVSWSNLIQYDNGSDTISLNSRVSWEIADGDDFFFVINQGWDADSDGITPNSGDITAKLGWTFRF